MPINILPLQNHLHFINEIATLHQTEWGHFNPDFTLEERMAALEKNAQKEGIPSIYIAIHNTEFCGSAALVAHDMDSHPELSPWLAAVFVKNKWRGQGIAQSLIRYCEGQAQKSGIHRLYLVTEFASSLYARLDWKTIEHCLYKGVYVDIMCKELS